METHRRSLSTRWEKLNWSSSLPDSVYKEGPLTTPSFTLCTCHSFDLELETPVPSLESGMAYWQLWPTDYIYHIVDIYTFDFKGQASRGCLLLLSEDSHDIKYNSAVEEIIPGDERPHSPSQAARTLTIWSRDKLFSLSPAQIAELWAKNGCCCSKFWRDLLYINR